jgi:xanthine/CO dehydrogenase XdhC/CoxF family maturation factor
MNDTLHNVARWADRGDRIAIAIVVGAMRSAPRPLGTNMAINDRREISGSVSGGSGEGTVVEIDERVIGSGHLEPLCPVWPRPIKNGTEAIELAGLPLHLRCAAWPRRSIRR